MIALVALLACGPSLGHPRIEATAALTLPLVHTSTDKNRWYVVLPTAQAGDRLWFLDSGYSLSTCDDGLVRDLGLPTRGRVVVHGEAGSTVATRAVLPELTVGSVHFEHVACVVRDLGSTSSIDDPPEMAVAGVIGSDILRRFDLLIDPSVPAVTLSPRGTQPLHRKDEGVVPLRREYGFGIRFRIPVDYGEHRIWPVVDTGASGTYIDGERLDLVPSRIDAGVSMRASGASGTIIRDLVYFDVDSANFAGLPGGHVMFTNRDRPSWMSGLLGLNVLSGYRQQYDFVHGLTRWTPVFAAEIPPVKAGTPDPHLHRRRPRGTGHERPPPTDNGPPERPVPTP